MIMNDKTRYKLLLLLSLTGIGISVLSALEGRVAWLGTFCGLFGEGCRETGLFTLLGISVWIWGAAYYSVLTGAILFSRPAVFWLIMASFGAEISFAWIMATLGLICIFCLLNAVVVVLLVALNLDKHRLWQAISMCLLALVITNLLLAEQKPGEIQRNSDKQSSSVVAQVGNEKITAIDLESPLTARIYGLQHEIYQLKRNYLEELIDRILIRKEAEKKGVTVQQLINSLSSDSDVVSDAEVDDYYRKNQSRWVNWSGTKKELLNRIRIYLQSQKNRKQIVDSLKPLKDQYPVKVYLAEPPLPFSNVTVGDSPVWGNPDAAVTIVEFSDYLCPACRAAHATTKKIREQYAGRIRWVFKNYPLARHKGARKLAEAAHCAGEQGKFWEFQDLLFASPENAGFEQLKVYAQQLGLDAKRFLQCFDNGKYGAKVDQDIREARQAGVNATPTFIINGRFQPGSLSFDRFKQIIEDELNRQ
jgi:protein-disulfide isomerase